MPIVIGLLMNSSRKRNDMNAANVLRNGRTPCLKLASSLTLATMVVGKSTGD